MNSCIKMSILYLLIFLNTPYLTIHVNISQYMGFLLGVTAENSKNITLENQAEISRRRGERRTVIGTKTISENLYVDKRATYPGKKRGISHKHPKEK